MTVEEAFVELKHHANPMQARCLNCCAYLRVWLLKMAWIDLARHDAADVDAGEIQTEVDRLFRDRPNLARRFKADGCPLDGECCQRRAAE